jgi:hypothetical protein
VLIELRDAAGLAYELIRVDRGVALRWPGPGLLFMPFLLDAGHEAEAAERVTWRLHSRALARLWLGGAARVRLPGRPELTCATDLTAMLEKSEALPPPASPPDAYAVYEEYGEVRRVWLKRGGYSSTCAPVLATLARDGQGGDTALWPTEPTPMRERPGRVTACRGRRAADAMLLLEREEARTLLGEM